MEGRGLQLSSERQLERYVSRSMTGQRPGKALALFLLPPFTIAPAIPTRMGLEASAA